jgi:predicted nuclease of predicted toxin-antitoxin system
MAQLFADENYDFRVVQELRKLGHDILTTFEAGLAGQQIPDDIILAFAANLGRAVLTHDNDYKRLHRRNPRHAGILFCSQDPDYLGLLQRLEPAIQANLPLTNKLIRVYKPATP